MNSSRARAIKLNMFSGWALELFALISGLILPRLVLTHFGSEANGLVSSITQYLGFAVILRAGLGGVTRAALYKPLAEKNVEQVSAIMVATQSYMRKVAMIIAGYIAIIASVFPLIAKSDYTWEYIFSMVLIIGSTTFADNFFGIKAKILLQADQKYYVQTLCTLASNVATFIISVVLIELGCSIMIVKIGAAAGSFVCPVLLNLYIKRHYRLNMKIAPDNLSIQQRWHAFAQQMAIIVNDNVALVLLTFFVDLKEISVYTVHNMIVVNLKRFVESCVNGVNSMFGDMLAKGERDALRKSFRFIEWAYLSVCTVIFSVTAVMFVPFIRIYTDSVTDVNYIRPLFAWLITAVCLMTCIRSPYQYLVEAAGHFKQTKNGSIMEVVINITVSLIAIYFFGVIGVLIGALVATTIRTLQYMLYATKKLLGVSVINLVCVLSTLLLVFGLSVLVSSLNIIPDSLNYLTWCVTSIVVLIAIVVIVLLLSLIFNRSELFVLKDKLFKKENRNA